MHCMFQLLSLKNCMNVNVVITQWLYSYDCYCSGNPIKINGFTVMIVIVVVILLLISSMDTTKLKE